MFQSLVITLREGVEAALILGIVLGYLKKTGRQAWSRYAWWGLGRRRCREPRRRLCGSSL